MADDPDATPRQRYDVLLRLVDAYRWSRDVAGADRHGRAGRRGGRGDRRPGAGRRRRDLDHPGRAVAVGARTARCTRAWCARCAPASTGCRRRTVHCAAGCCSALANELYYGASFEERRALVDEGLAMARRLGDETLLLDACQIAFVSLWSTGTAAERLALVEEAVDLAARTGNERATVVARHAAGGGPGRAGPSAGDVGGRRVDARRGGATADALRADGARQPGAAVARDGRPLRRSARSCSAASASGRPDLAEAVRGRHRRRA